MIKISEKDIKEAISRLSKTEDGRMVLVWLKNMCNWDMSLMSADQSMTQHHASIRGVWGKVRQSIHVDDLKAIEHDYIIYHEVSKKAGKK